MKNNKVERKCENCGSVILVYPSRIKNSNSGLVFCDKSCHRIYKNRLDNPSKYIDWSGKNNPMYGKHPTAWNKGLKGENSHNWKGGLHKRKDGYLRININGKRQLYHRYLLNLKRGEKVVHHIDHNPSNNDLKNLMIFENQREHVKYEVASNSSIGR